MEILSGLKIKNMVTRKVLAQMNALMQNFDTSLGVEITADQIYIVQVRKYFRSFKILNELEVPRDKRTNPQDQILEILKRPDMKNSYLSVSLPKSKVFIKIIRIPYISEHKIGAFLSQYLSDIIPVPLERNSICIRYIVLSKTSESIKLILFIARITDLNYGVGSDLSISQFFNFSVDEYYLLGFLLNKRPNFTGYWINHNGNYDSLYQFDTGRIIAHHHYSCNNSGQYEKFDLGRLEIEAGKKNEGFYTGLPDMFAEIIARFPYFTCLFEIDQVSKPAYLNAYTASISPFINFQFSQKLIFGQMEPQQTKDYLNRKLRQIVMAGAICIAALYSLLSVLNIVLSHQNKETMNNIGEINQRREELKLLQEEYESIILLLEYYHSISSNKLFISYYIFHISKILPENLFLIRLEISQTRQKLVQIELSGHSKTETAIYDLIIHLEEEHFIKNCHLEEMKRNDNNSYGKVKNLALIKFKIFVHV